MADEENDSSLEDSFDLAYRDLCEASIGLLVNVGIISSIRERWPDDAQENWVREVQNMTEKLEDHTRTAQEFASSFD